MLKNKSKGILIILLFLFTTLFSNTKLVFADNDNYKLEINYGIDGSYKSGKYVPFEVKVTAAENFVGEVEIKVKSNMADMYDSYSKELSIEAGKSSTVLIPVNFINGNEACQIYLIDSNGKVLTTKNVNITNGRINEYSIAVGILTEDKSALSYLSSISINNKNSGYVSLIESLPITTDYLGDLGLSIDGLDAIIINNFNVANLSETNYNALENWIEKGGTLIIGSGANEAKTIKSIDSKFLNVKTSGTKEETVNLLGDTLNIVSSNITLENSNPIILGQEDSLAYSVSKGNGEVIVATFDLGLEPFISSNVTEEVIITLLNTPYEKLDSSIQGGYSGYSYTNLTNSLPIGKIANFKLIVTIIAVYAVLVGFVAYIVLKAMNKRDLTWIVIPALSLIFTIVIYFFGANTRFKDIILNQINIVNIKEDGVGNLKGYIGISSEHKDEIIIQNNNNAFNAIKENYYYYNIENSGYKNLALKTLYKEDTAQYKIGKGGSLTTTPFEALGGEIVVDKITYDLKMKGNSIDGTITNNFDYDIEKLLVVSNKIIWDFGYVKAKETKTVENVNIVSNNGLQNYAQIALSEKYYNDRYNSSKDLLSDEYKNILRNYNLLSTISNEESFNKEKIVAITSVPFDYSLQFNDKSVSKFDTTVIIQDIELNFKDESGVYNYPEGYFSGEYTYNSKEVNFNEYQNELYGTGEAIINYNLAKDINFEEVGLRIKRDYDYLPSTQAIEIYNRESESYESMLITEDKSVINNLDKYLDKNNVITIKIQIDDYKGDAIIPVISAKGRAK